MEIKRSSSTLSLVVSIILPFALTLLLIASIMPASANPGSWFIETVDNEGFVGSYTSIALDNNGRPHISYYDLTNDDLKYARWDGSAWQIETVDSAGDVGLPTSIALDDNGWPHISYAFLKYARWDGSAWQIETVDVGVAGRDTSIALDSNNRPHISYYNEGDHDLKYARWDESAWQIETVDSAGDVGSHTSIALDDNDWPHISYWDYTNLDLKYARWDGSAWQIETVDSGGWVGWHTSIALDSNNRPHISYYDETNDDLKYARWDGSAWQIETVDSGGNVGRYTSIALDDNNQPHISYYSESGDDLRYARWDGSAWQIETVDSAGDVGWYTSIALDDINLPHISYWDYTNHNLKYAVVLGAGVEVSISPSYDENLPGGTLIYTITVRNTGLFLDNYDLTVSDDLGWDLTFETRLENIPSGENEQVTLSVTIPEDAQPCTVDNIRVKATSQVDSRASDESTCRAHVKAPPQRVSILPPEDNGVLGETIVFTVTVTNTGEVVDSYDLAVTDDKNWGLTLDNYLFEDVAPGDGRVTTLRVTIPEDAEPSTEDTVTVTATSQTDNLARDNGSCIVHAVIPVPGVSVSISPDENEGVPGENVTFTVTITNTGNVTDNYDLTVGDNASPSWGLTLDNYLFEDVAPGEDRTTTLTVTISNNAIPCTRDNIRVTATSQKNTDVSDSASCTAHAKTPLEVSISPSENEAGPGYTVTFTVTVTNIGVISDSYDLVVTDDENWDPTLGVNLFEDVAPDEDRATTLTVTLPENAMHGTDDTITVTATSRGNASISAEDTCVTRVVILRKFKVSISPGSQVGPTGENIIFTVTVANLGSTSENYALTVIDNASWGAWLDDALLEDVQPGENRQVTLNVGIPSDAVENERTEVTVTATLAGGPSASVTSTVIAWPKGPGFMLPVVPIAVTVALAACLVLYLIYIRPL